MQLSWNAWKKWRYCISYTDDLDALPPYVWVIHYFLRFLISGFRIAIPARHDILRRISADWIAGVVVRRIESMAVAREMMADLACNLASRSLREYQPGG